MAQSRARWIPVFVLLAVSAARLDGQSVLRQGVEFQVNSYTTNDQEEPAIDLDADGDFVVTWTSTGQDGGARGIFGRRFNENGVSQSLDFGINSFTVGEQQRSAVGLAPGGAFVVAWDSYDQDGTGGSGVFARRFDAAGVAQAAEFQVNIYTNSYQGRPAVAVSAAGNFVVAWQSYQQDGSLNGIFARRFDAAGTGLATEFQVNTHTADSQADAAVALDDDGDFVIAWSSTQQDGSEYGVFARRFDSSGAAQGVEFQVNAVTAGLQALPTVARRGDGAFLVAWATESDGGSYGVSARVFNSTGVPQAADFQVNTYITGTQTAPAVGVDGADRFVVAWQSVGQDGSDYGIFARRFGTDGAPQSDELQVNSYNLSAQQGAAIAFDGGHRFVVAWTSEDSQDGSGNGVFAQRFSTAAILDVDANGSVTALTDGLLIVRFLFGFTGTTLTNGVIGAGCMRCDSAAIVPYLEGLV